MLGLQDVGSISAVYNNILFIFTVFLSIWFLYKTGPVLIISTYMF